MTFTFTITTTHITTMHNIQLLTLQLLWQLHDLLLQGVHILAQTWHVCNVCLLLPWQLDPTLPDSVPRKITPVTNNLPFLVLCMWSAWRWGVQSLLVTIRLLMLTMLLLALLPLAFALLPLLATTTLLLQQIDVHWCIPHIARLLLLLLGCRTQINDTCTIHCLIHRLCHLLCGAQQSGTVNGQLETNCRF